MVKKEYAVEAFVRNVSPFLVGEGLESREEAKGLIGQIIKQAATRRSRFISAGDVVFDPDGVVAYRIWERECYEDGEIRCECDVDYDESGVVELEFGRTVVTDGPDQTPEPTVVFDGGVQEE